MNSTISLFGRFSLGDDPMIY